jgi:hypothetical protein
VTATSKQIPWYYIWSPKYAIFHNILYSNISNVPELSVRPVFFPQSFFERKADTTHHPFEGNLIKIKVIVEALEQHPGENVIVSDADIVVLKPELLYEYLQDYKEIDMVFMMERPDLHTYANIGFGLIKSNENTIDFFKRMVSHIETHGGHDQTIYNDWIAEGKFEGTTGLFSIPELLQSNIYKEVVAKNTENKPVIMVQCLSSADNYTMNTVEKLLTAIIFVDISELVGLISEDVFELLKGYIEVLFPSGNPLLSVEYPRKADEDSGANEKN